MKVKNILFTERGRMKFCKLIKLQQPPQTFTSITEHFSTTTPASFQSYLKEIRVKELAINYKGDTSTKKRGENELQLLRCSKYTRIRVQILGDKHHKDSKSICKRELLEYALAPSKCLWITNQNGHATISVRIM